MRKIRNIYKTSVGKRERRHHLEDFGIDEKKKHYKGRERNGACDCGLNSRGS
jgi:hypothetical protein